MQARGLNIQNALLAIVRSAAGLFHQPTHGVGLVQQAQFAGFFRFALIPRVHVHAAAHEDAVHIGHHAGNPAHVEIFAAHAFLALQALVHIAFDGCCPVAHIAHINGKLLGVFRDAHVFLCEKESAAIQREHDYAMPCGKHQNGLRPVQAIASSDLLVAGLKKILRLHLAGARRFLEYAEDGADAHVHIDIAGAVQWVEHEQVVPLRVGGRNGVDIVHFFRSHGGQIAAPFIALEHDFIGDDVEFFLFFTLYILATCAAQYAAQSAFVHSLADVHTSIGHAFNQGAQLGRQFVVLLLFKQIAGQRNGFAHDECS